MWRRVYTYGEGCVYGEAGGSGVCMGRQGARVCVELIVSERW